MSTLGKYTIFSKITGKYLKNLSCAGHQIEGTYAPDTEIIYNAIYDHTYQVNLSTFIVEKIPSIHEDSPAYYITDLQQYIQDDNALDKAIENLHEDPITYKQDNYELFRKWTYPDSMEYIDAAVKQKDSKRKKDGDKQMADYVNKCLVVKDRFPKKEE